MILDRQWSVLIIQLFAAGTISAHDMFTYMDEQVGNIDGFCISSKRNVTFDFSTTAKFVLSEVISKLDKIVIKEIFNDVNELQFLIH